MGKIIILENSNILDTDCELICHQVNCMGVMGSGVALAISNKWKVVKEAYIDFHGNMDNSSLLGKVQYVMVNKEQRVVNMFSQHTFGRGGKHTNYDAMRKCFKDIKERSLMFNYRIALPYGIGCGLGGGDWDVVYKIIEEELDGCEVYIYKLGK